MLECYYQIYLTLPWEGGRTLMENILDQMGTYGHNEFKAFRDDAAGLKGFVAIHDTTLGPAAGGTRRYNFDSAEEAIRDVLRLSRAMTYKYAISGVNMGGAKSVIWVDDDDHCTEELYRAHGRVVDSFDGRWITGADVGTDERELRWIGMETDYIVGLPEQFDHPEGYDSGARGLIRAMEASCELVYGGDRSLSDIHVAIQGVGEMGMGLLEYLDDRGAQITATDIDAVKLDTVADEYGVNTVEPEDIYGVDCDVFAPCALGFVINDETVPQLECDIVCGAANNQLDDEEKHSRALHDRGILYIPDYLANSGRTIDDTDLLRKGGYKHERAKSMIDEIYTKAMEIGNRAESADQPTLAVADTMVEERIAAMKRTRQKVDTTRTPQW